MNIPDAYDLWEAHDREQTKQLEKLPKCADCCEHIQDDHYYLINDEIICPTCIEGYRKDIENWE